MTDRLYTIPITCYLDGQAHDVTDENVAIGNHTGEYQALCGHRVSASPMVAPVGQPCRRCTEVSAAAHPAAAHPAAAHPAAAHPAAAHPAAAHPVAVPARRRRSSPPVK